MTSPSSLVVRVSTISQCVVIDEAHALTDTILNSKTVAISLDNLVTALQCASVYKNRFKAVLKGTNSLHLSYLITACKKLAEFCQHWAKKQQQPGQQQQQQPGGCHELLLPSQLVQELGLDQMPMRDLDQWLRDSMIARKMSGYAEVVAEKSKEGQCRNWRIYIPTTDADDDFAFEDKKAIRVATVSMLYRIQAFLVALAEPDKDGRIIVSLEPGQSKEGAVAGRPTLQLKYLLLNPEDPFRSLVEEARSVVLAGGWCHIFQTRILEWLALTLFDRSSGTMSPSA